MKIIISTIVALTVTMSMTLTTASAAPGAPQRCPNCYNKYHISYTICDYVNIKKTKLGSYTLWEPVGKPVQNCDKKAKKLSFSAGKSTTVTYEVSGTFKYSALSLGAKYTLQKSQTTGVSVPTADKVKPNYYAQMYIGTNLDKYKVVGTHCLRCFKCGYVYKKNTKTETSTIAAPLKSQALKTKTKVAKKAADVSYKEITYCGCRGRCGK